MATVLERARGGQRGLIVLTHKEIFLLEHGKLTKGSRRSITSPNLARFARKVMSRIRDDYLVGAHIGGKISPDHPVFSGSFQDFTMATPLQWRASNAHPVVPLVSAFFIPKTFSKYTRRRRSWDLIHVATDGPGKNWDRFVSIAAQLISQQPHLRILTVSTHGSEKSQSHLRSKFEKIKSEISGGLHHISLLTKNGERGLPAAVMANLLGDSKVICLFSQSEGTPKIITEAMMAGCFPVVYEDLLRTCSFLPDLATYENTMKETKELEKISAAITRFSEEISDRMCQVAQAKFELVKNVQYLQIFLRDLTGQDWDLPKHEDLRLRLPAHTRNGADWFRDKTNVSTTDLATRKNWADFESWLRQVRPS